MKKDFFISAMAMLVLAACGSGQKQTASEETRVTREQLTFPVGDRIDNPAFTGEAYLKPHDSASGHAPSRFQAFRHGVVALYLEGRAIPRYLLHLSRQAVNAEVKRKAHFSFAFHSFFRNFGRNCRISLYKGSLGN